MGKTNPTHRDQINSIEEAWNDYRRMLRHHHQPVFDQLFKHARDHADAGSAANPMDPMHSVLMSVCLEQQQAINELEERLEARDE